MPAALPSLKATAPRAIRIVVLEYPYPATNYVLFIVSFGTVHSLSISVSISIIVRFPGYQCYRYRYHTGYRYEFLVIDIRSNTCLSLSGGGSFPLLVSEDDPHTFKSPPMAAVRHAVRALCGGQRARGTAFIYKK